jgi:hypothetical protein
MAPRCTLCQTSIPRWPAGSSALAGPTVPAARGAVRAAAGPARPQFFISPSIQVDPSLHSPPGDLSSRPSARLPRARPPHRSVSCLMSLNGRNNWPFFPAPAQTGPLGDPP